MPSDAPGARVALLIVAQPSYDYWEPLTEIGAAVAKLSSALVQHGSRYQLHLPELQSGGNVRVVEQTLSRWFAQLTEKDRLVLYWTGHGARSGKFYFIAKDSPRTGLSAGNAVSAGWLGDIVANCKAEKILFFIDTCYSSEGAVTIVGEISEILKSRTHLPGQEPFICMIPSAHSLQKAPEAVFCRTLLEVLTGTTSGVRRWSDQDELIRAGDLSYAVLKAMSTSMGPGWQPPLPTTAGYDDLFVPNPRFRHAPAIDVETGRRLLEVPEALKIAVRGVEVGEAGWYFSGRTSILRELISWLGTPRPGLAVLTGPPGSGKSAVLGRLLLLSDETFRSEAARAGVLDGSLESTSPVPEITAAIHARGKALDDCVRAIAAQVGASGVSDAPIDSRGLIEALRVREPRCVIIVDALDESADPVGIGGFLRRLAAEGQARILVGSRRSPDGRTLPDDVDRHNPLRALFGNDARLLDLADEATTPDDIAAYVRARLERSRHREQPASIAAVSQRVAARARGLFLYARVVARTLQDAERLDGSLPDGPIDAFANDLKARFGERVELVNALFAGLAWAEGEGLSRSCWPLVASAVAGSDRAYSDADVDWVLEHAGWHILQTGEGGQTVYRLVHQAFTDHYRVGASDARSVQRRILARFTSTLSGLDWLNADQYVRRYLARHAALGGNLDSLVSDPAFLAVAAPARLVAALPHVSDRHASRLAAIYRRVAHVLEDVDAPERMAVLHLAAQQNDPAMAPTLLPLLQPRWQSHWAHWRRAVPWTVLASAPRDTVAAAAITVDGVGPVLVCSTSNELHGWAIEDFAELSESASLDGTITAMLVDTVLDGPIVVAATERGTLATFSLPGFQRIAERPAAHDGEIRSLTVVRGEGALALASAGKDKALTLWTLPALEPIRRRPSALLPYGQIASATLRGTAVIVSSGDTRIKAGDEGSGFWDTVETGPIAVWSVPDLERQSTFGTDVEVNALHVVEVDGTAVVLGSYLGHVRAWVLGTGEALALPPDDSDDAIRALFFLPVDSPAKRKALFLNAYGALRTLVLARSWGKISIEATPWIETEGGLWCGPIALWGRSHLISVDHEIHLWDCADLTAAIESAPRTSEAMFQQQRSFGFVSAVGVHDVVWGATDAGPIHIFDAASGRERRVVPSPGGTPVTVSTMRIDGRAVVVVAYSTGIVRFLDARSGQPALADITVDAAISHLAVDPADDGTGFAVVAAWRDARGETTHRVSAWAHPFAGEIENQGRRDTPRLDLAGWDDKALNAIAFGEYEHERILVAGGDALVIGAWNAATFKRVQSFIIGFEWGHVSSLAVCRLRDGEQLVAGTTRGVLIAWDLYSGMRSNVRPGSHRHSTYVNSVDWGGAPMLASGGAEGILRVWASVGEMEAEIRLDAPIKGITQLKNRDLVVATLRGVVVLTPP